MSTDLNALVFSGVRGDTRRYRALHLYQQMRMLGIPARLGHLVAPDLPRWIAAADLIVVHRAAANPALERALLAARQRGALLLADTDDLIFDPQAFQYIHNPEFREPVRTQLYREEMLRHRRTMELCAGALVSTEYLAGEVAKLGLPVRVHRNAASLEMWDLARSPEQAPAAAPGRFVLGYASGSPTHNRDFALIQPALQAFLRSQPQAELRLIGFLDLDPSWQEFKGRIQHDPLLPWCELPAWLAQLDLNLAPLQADNPFSLSKSEIKWLEAALVSVPTIASRTPAFEYAVRHGVNGWLAGSPAEWEDALHAALDADLRCRCAARAYADALAGYRPQIRVGELRTSLQSLAQSAGIPLGLPDDAGEPSEEILRGSRLAPQMEQFPARWQEGLYNLRTRGPWTLARQVWAFGIRELRRRTGT